LTTNPSPSKPKLVEEGNEKWCGIKKKGDDIIQEEIRILLNTPILLQAIRFIKNSSRNSSRPSNLVSTPLSSTISKKYEIRPNAAAQKASYKKIKTARNKITKFESLYNIVSDTSIRSDLAIRIQEQKDIVRTNDKKIEALKRHAANQARIIAKKQNQLEEEGIVKQWEKCGKYFPTLNFVQKHKQSQHSARKSQNSNSATHEFIYSQPYMLIELYVSIQIKENDFEYSLSDSEMLR
ncbi:17873_t:CDS:2, partial [Dentiscutata erythropus]